MRKKMLVFAIALTALLSSAITADAAPKTMPDGTVFDAEYYAASNPDVVNALGTGEDALYRHYVDHGRAEGRKPCGVVSATQEALDAADALHKYYKGIPEEYAEAAEQIAANIAGGILENPDYQTDLERVNAAAQIVKSYCDNSVYYSDPDKFYRSPAGLFSLTYYTCAGSTRTLGRILDYMGYEWAHTNENENRHQWCVLTMDGQTGFADGMGGFAGYGELRNGMTLPDGSIIFFAE